MKKKFEISLGLLSRLYGTYFFRIYKEIQRQEKFQEKFHHSSMAFTLFIVVIIFVLCQSVRCITNIVDGIVHFKYNDCLKSNADDPTYGIPSWTYILHVFTRVLLVLNR